MRTELRRDLTDAMKRKDRATVSVLRSALAAIDNAEAQPVPDAREAAGGEHLAGTSPGVGSAEVARRELSPAEVRAVVAAERSERLDGAGEYDRLGDAERAQRLRAEAALLDRYLTDA